MTIKTVLFDLDYTLMKTGEFKKLSKNASIIKMQAEAMEKFKIKIPRKLLDETIDAVRKEKSSNYERILDETALIVCRQLGINEQFKIDMIAAAGISGHHMVKDAYFTFIYEEVNEILYTLNDMGIQICLATAGKTHKQIDKINWAHLNRDIDLVFVTQQFIEETKANQTIDVKTKEFFLWILEKINKTHNEVIMIGDIYHNDIEPAKNAGLWTIHVDRKCSSGRVKGEKADYMVEDLTSLPKIINSINEKDQQ